LDQAGLAGRKFRSMEIGINASPPLNNLSGNAA
jgi:hypothetical protein